MAREPYWLAASLTNPFTAVNVPGAVREWLNPLRVERLEFQNSPESVIEDLFRQVNV